jgi:hypothetical protein
MADTLNSEIEKIAKDGFGMTTPQGGGDWKTIEQKLLAIVKSAKVETLSLPAAAIFKGYLEEYTGPAFEIAQDLMVSNFELIAGNIKHLQNPMNIRYALYLSLMDGPFLQTYFEDEDSPVTVEQFQELADNVYKLLTAANEAALEVASQNTKDEVDGEDPLIGRMKSLPELVRRVARLSGEQQIRMRQLLKILDGFNESLAGGAMRGRENDTTVWFDLIDWFGDLPADDVGLLSLGIRDTESLSTMIHDGFIVQAEGLCNDELGKRLGKVVKAYHAALK